VIPFPKPIIHTLNFIGFILRTFHIYFSHFTETYFFSKCCRPIRLDNCKEMKKFESVHLSTITVAQGYTVSPLKEQEDMHTSLHTSAPLHSGHQVIRNEGVTTPVSPLAASVTQSQ
jgi:hypothetical protein